MAQLTVVYWRDIPAQVIVKAGRKKAAAPLPERFEQGIDRAAMRSGAAGTDDYLAEWRRVAAGDLEGDDLQALALEAANRLDAEYDPQRLKTLIDNDGRAPVGG